MPRPLTPILALTACAPALVCAAEPSRPAPEYDVKAQILRKLLDWLKWPSLEAGRPLVVGVLEPSRFEDYLQKQFEGVTIDGHSVKLRYLRGLSQIQQCDLLFIPEEAEASLGTILNSLKGKPVILVGDTEGFAQRGVTLNLVIVNQRTRLEVNITTLKNSGVNLSPQVLKGAVIYR